MMTETPSKSSKVKILRRVLFLVLGMNRSRALLQSQTRVNQEERIDFDNDL